MGVRTLREVHKRCESPEELSLIFLQLLLSILLKGETLQPLVAHCWPRNRLVSATSDV